MLVSLRLTCTSALFPWHRPVLQKNSGASVIDAPSSRVSRTRSSTVTAADAPGLSLRNSTLRLSP